MSEKMTLTSKDVLAERIALLREEFPEIFTEDKIDFDKLKEALGIETTADRERYSLSWAGKSEAIRNVQIPSVGTLVPDPEESVNFDTTENLFIEGDNLEVLKLLQKSYHGRVKMIYIDPPYNTGNEFIYPDNFREGLEDYLRYSGQVNGEGFKLSTNTETSGRYHSKWLNMMYPRLFLARNLLREDGVIFVSIDDHEVHNLRLLMNEIFGEENFIATICWQKFHSVKSNAEHISQSHDYVVIFARSAEVCVLGKLQMSEDALKVYKNPDNDPRGPWRTAPLTVSLLTGSRGESFKRTGKSSGLYDIVSPTGKVHRPGPGRAWISRQTFEKLEADNRIWWGKDGNAVPMKKRFLSETEGLKAIGTFWNHKDYGSNKKGSTAGNRG